MRKHKHASDVIVTVTNWKTRYSKSYPLTTWNDAVNGLGAVGVERFCLIKVQDY